LWELRPARDGRGTRPANHRFTSAVEFSYEDGRMIEIQTSWDRAYKLSAVSPLLDQS
jgi:hypothetical protein